MEASERLLEMLRRHEGLRLRAYRCAGGRWTVGYGHTAGVGPDTVVTAAEAEALLRADAAAALEVLDGMCREAGVTLTQGQRDALADFVFNLGAGALRGSTLWRRVCRGDAPERVTAELMRWVHASGRVMPGLVARRREEARLYAL